MPYPLRPAAALGLSGGLLALTVALLPAVAPAAAPGGPAAAGLSARARQNKSLVPIRGVLGRRIDPAPAGADALRVTVYGDASGGRLQVRLLAPGQDGALTGYFAAPEIDLDFEGWKTLTLPLSGFAFRSDSNPEIARDGTGGVEALANASGVQIAVTSPASRVFVDELAWVGAAAAETDAPLAVIDAFEETDVVTRWKPVGDFNERRAVDHSVNKVAKFVKNGSGSLQMVVRSRSQTEMQLHESALRARLSRTPASPYVVYARAPFEVITPDSTPAPAEVRPAPAVALFASPGEIEPTTFAVYSARALKNATVAVKGPLVSPAVPGRGAVSIPAAALDVHVVRNGGTAENAPQLLMKDDRQDLTGPSPKVRLTGAPATDIPAGSSKQFWVTVRVPANQRPGTYKGTLTFSAPGVKPTPVAISVEVLPLALKTAHFQYGIDLTSTLGEPTQPGERKVSPEEYSAQLVNIRDHGFKLLALHGDAATLAEELKLYKQANVSLAGPVVVASPLGGATSDFVAIEQLRAAAGLAPTFEFYYRLPTPTLTDPEAARRYAEAAKGANFNALLVASVDSGANYGALAQSVGDSLAPVYAVSSDYAQKVLAEGRRFTSNRDWWAWNISRQSAVRNRLLAGFLLLKTGNGMYGAFPGPYQSIPDGADPYSVLRATAATDAAPTSPDAPRPQLAAFPVEGGVLDTLQWEAVREGIDDVRYYDVLKAVSRELKDLKLRKDATDLAESYLIGILSKPALTMTPAQHQSFRRGIADQAIGLRAILEKAPRPK